MLTLRPRAANKTRRRDVWGEGLAHGINVSWVALREKKKKKIESLSQVSSQFDGKWIWRGRKDRPIESRAPLPTGRLNLRTDQAESAKACAIPDLLCSLGTFGSELLARRSFIRDLSAISSLSSIHLASLPSRPVHPTFRSRRNRASLGRILRSVKGIGILQEGNPSLSLSLSFQPLTTSVRARNDQLLLIPAELEKGTPEDLESRCTSGIPYSSVQPLTSLTILLGYIDWMDGWFKILNSSFLYPFIREKISTCI